VARRLHKTTPAAHRKRIYFEDKVGAEEMFIHASRIERRTGPPVDNIKVTTRKVGQNYALHVDDRMTDRGSGPTVTSAGTRSWSFRPPTAGGFPGRDAIGAERRLRERLALDTVEASRN
jgi:hypothetical protein